MNYTVTVIKTGLVQIQAPNFTQAICAAANYDPADIAWQDNFVPVNAKPVQNSHVTLAQMFDVMERRQNDVCYLVFQDTGNLRTAEKKVMPVADARASFGDWPVRACVAYIHEDGEFAGYIYQIAEPGEKAGE